MKKKLLFNLLTAISIMAFLTAFTPENYSDGTHYYFAFDREHGQYTNIVRCYDSDHLDGHGHGNYYVYGPYETYDNAMHRRQGVIREYENHSHYRATYKEILHCN